MEQYLLDELNNHKLENEKGRLYLSRYIRFVEWCLHHDFGEQKFCYHHIVPRSWNNNLIDDKNNIVKIPKRHHVFAHLLLAKTLDKKMLHALSYMHNKNPSPYEKKQIEIANRLRKARKVINLTTGEVFASGAMAGEKYHVNRSAVSTAIKRRIRLCGCYWHYLDVVEKIGMEEALHYYDREVDTSFQVWNLTTKTLYNNAEEAAIVLGVSKRAIYAAISRHIRYKNCYWAFERDVKQKESMN